MIWWGVVCLVPPAVERPVYLACLVALVALVGLWRHESAAADGGVAPAVASEASPLEKIIELWAGKPAGPVVAVRHDSQSQAAGGAAQPLVTEPDKPEEYQALVADSLYPPTAAPQKLTAGQLDAIAKLAPKPNKDGMRVHPAMVPLFRSMVLHYSGGTYDKAPLRFRLHVPEPFQKGKTYPLVVWLHGAGECGSDNVNQLSHLHHIIPYLVGPKKRDFFLLVPQCPHAHVAWEAPEICSTTVRADGSVECHVVNDPAALANAPLAYTMAMIEAVMKEFPVDPNRVTVAGLSTGGDGVWRMLERRAGPLRRGRAAGELGGDAGQLAARQTASEEDPHLGHLQFGRPRHRLRPQRVRAHARRRVPRLQDRVRRLRASGLDAGHAARGHLRLAHLAGRRTAIASLPPRLRRPAPEKIGIFADVTEGDLKREADQGGSPNRRPAHRAEPAAGARSSDPL